MKRVGRELGVRYVLEGAVRKAGGRVRISAQLIDALSGTHLWADRFEGSLADIFDLQDNVASRIAGVIEPALQAAETARSADRPTNDLTAYDLHLRAYEMFFASATLIPEALCLLERAIERDPRYGPALAWAAVCRLRLVGDGSSTDPAADSRKSVEFARRALQAAGDDPGSGQCRVGAGPFRRGYRLDDSVDRSSAGDQPELCPRLVHPRHSRALCRRDSTAPSRMPKNRFASARAVGSVRFSM